MNRSTTLFAGLRPAALLLLIGLVVATTMLAATAFGGRGNTAIGAPLPSATPQSTPKPSVEPSAEPTDGGHDAIPLNVVLDDLIGHDVYVDIVDSTGLLAGAESGTPTASASVAVYTLLVENIDARTLRLTWVDRPGDNALALYIDQTESGYRLLMVQPEHDAGGDAIVHDRVLILEFSQAISAHDVEAFLQDGLDTPG